MSLEISSLPPPPKVSLHTLPMAGLLVDVYGLDELGPDTAHVSCLWLHHQRTRSKAYMADIAARCVGAWNASQGQGQDRDRDRDGEEAEEEEDKKTGSSSGRRRGRTRTRTRRGLIALAYDQRNHGTRLVSERANASWREGNPAHAVDMFACVQGMVADQRGLIDLVEGYLFPDDAGGVKRTVDQHLALGVSLGGHSVWQLMFAEPRVEAGAVIVGCPDFMYLLSDRARLSRLATYSAQDNGASFLGSKDFPPSLVEACCKGDPKGIFFGTGAVPDAAASGPDNAARQIVRERLRGKRFLLCSGEVDKLVPLRCSEPFLHWFKQATRAWFKDENVSVDDRIYPGVGHAFSADMVVDSVQFVMDAVADAEERDSAGGKDDEQRASKI